MPDEKPAVVIPEVPPFPNVPESVKKQWRANYAEAFRQAQTDQPNESNLWPQLALREANRIFRVPQPASYEEAMQLRPWQVLAREESDGQLRLVTVDAKKYRFPLPARPEASGGAKETKAKS